MSDVTVGHTVRAAPLAHAVVMVKLGDVLGTRGSVPVDVPQEVIQGVGAHINSGHDGAIGAENVVKKLPSFRVNYWGNLCGAGAEPLEVSSVVVGLVEIIDEGNYLFIDS